MGLVRLAFRCASLLFAIYFWCVCSVAFGVVGAEIYCVAELCLNAQGLDFVKVDQALML